MTDLKLPKKKSFKDKNVSPIVQQNYGITFLKNKAGIVTILLQEIFSSFSLFLLIFIAFVILLQLHFIRFVFRRIVH